MSIKLNSNIASLNAQRNFGSATKKLTDAYTRLSSGLRINKAADDAAGLAIYTSLKSDARVYSAAIKNANDFISATSIAESALGEVSNILDRLDELATQAQNGTYSFKQRQALDKEAKALVLEANRIVNSTKFNGIDLLSDPSAIGDAALGYGAQETLDTHLGEAFQATVSDGTIKVVNSANGPTGQGGNNLALADFNEDGNIDIAAGQTNGYALSVNLGNGDGTYLTGTAFYQPYLSTPYSIEATDFDSDGHLDIIIAAGDGASTYLLLQAGNGDGSFKSATTLTNLDTGAGQMALGDFNDDGMIDVAVYTTGVGGVDVEVFIGGVRGTLTKTGYVGGGASGGGTLTVDDFNNDGKLDIFANDYLSSSSRISLGNGDGSFKGPTVVNLSSGDAAESNGNNSLASSDLNGDGNKDIVFATSGGNLTAMLGRGDGTFQNSYYVSGLGSRDWNLTIKDINGDNIDDVISGRENGGVNIYIGNGDGTFNWKSSTLGNATGQFASAVRSADLNNDGALDFVTNTYPLTTEALKIFISNTTKSSTIAKIDLSTIMNAREAGGVIDSVRARVQKERVNIGSVESRLLVAISSLSQRNSGLKEAASLIEDADVAEESAKLVATQILQQSAASVLSQANFQPRLVLQLLEGI